jgi:hypothetical protein
MLEQQLEQPAGRGILQKCFFVFSFLPYLAGQRYDDLALILGFCLIISTIAIIASIYCWRHNQDIRFLIMAFLVSAFPVFLFLFLYTLLFFFGTGV